MINNLLYNTFNHLIKKKKKKNSNLNFLKI